MTTSVAKAATARARYQPSADLLGVGVVLTIVGLILLGLAAYLQLTYALPTDGTGTSATADPDAVRALISGVGVTLGGLFALATAVVRLARNLELVASRADAGS
jgi:hypothetical protein